MPLNDILAAIELAQRETAMGALDELKDVETCHAWVFSSVATVSSTLVVDGGSSAKG